MLEIKILIAEFLVLCNAVQRLIVELSSKFLTLCNKQVKIIFFFSLPYSCIVGLLIDSIIIWLVSYLVSWLVCNIYGRNQSGCENARNVGFYPLFFGFSRVILCHGIADTKTQLSDLKSSKKLLQFIRYDILKMVNSKFKKV